MGRALGYRALVLCQVTLPVPSAKAGPVPTGELKQEGAGSGCGGNRAGQAVSPEVCWEPACLKQAAPTMLVSPPEALAQPTKGFGKNQISTGKKSESRYMGLHQSTTWCIRGQDLWSAGQPAEWQDTFANRESDTGITARMLILENA